jgi:hypothetical protein
LRNQCCRRGCISRRNPPASRMHNTSWECPSTCGRGSLLVCINQAVEANGESRPDEIRVLSFQPVAAFTALVEAARPLRHDPFKAELTRLGANWAHGPRHRPGGGCPPAIARRRLAVSTWRAVDRHKDGPRLNIGLKTRIAQATGRRSP